MSYYRLLIDNPTSATSAYVADCNDIIEGLELNFAEANVLKAVWRRAAARQGKAKRGYSDGLYDAEKIVFFGKRILAQEKSNRQKAEPRQVFDGANAEPPTPPAPTDNWEEPIFFVVG